MYKSLEKYIVYFKESTSFYGSDPKPLNKIKCFNSDKQYYHKWIKDKLIDSILRVYCMSNTWSIITMATFSSDLFEGCRFMWYRDFEEIRTQCELLFQWKLLVRGHAEIFFTEGEVPAKWNWI